MSLLLERLQHWSETKPEHLALQGEDCCVTWQALAEQVDAVAAQILQLGIRRLALRADNRIEWAVIDLAALASGCTLIPVPSFFNAEQVAHLLNDSGADFLLGDWPGAHGEQLDTRLAGFPLWRRSVENPAVLHEGTVKVTYTSGSTGQPKGVCLSVALLESVAVSLLETVPVAQIDRHLMVLPLSTLLENITGLYLPLLAGVTSVILPSAAVGLSGSSQFDPAMFARALAMTTPGSLVLTPALLQALLMLGQHQPELLEPVRFVAVGGSKVSPALLQHAHSAGVPVFEGYGLSECGSVVSFNSMSAHKPGSVGRILPHCQVRIAEDGEIIVAGASMLGYLGAEPAADEIATGDLGYLDAEGFLHIAGRKKNQLITSYGRNISPEWVEAFAQLQPALRQFVVFGDARPYLSAVVFSETPERVPEAIAALNAQLPDYARIGGFVLSEQSLFQIPDLMTANGRPRRERIADLFAESLSDLYDNEEEFHVIL
ncbi:AMP-dependent synthetase/ligase [Pontibacterium granulatum]|uniref:AMP-dependent synthetase/ligase n=1 Tax=Pontibacterium granulatum TaxID=2036029 RepID=UPI00249C8FDA|nr:AMP-dependent synthetase/ligase [Pontibacterium granulatum]MDI3323444.1 AMP-dependent synthetase/ligase [Pontibacterium granulatum]